METKGPAVTVSSRSWVWQWPCIPPIQVASFPWHLCTRHPNYLLEKPIGWKFLLSNKMLRLFWEEPGIASQRAESLHSVSQQFCSWLWDLCLSLPLSHSVSLKPLIALLPLFEKTFLGTCSINAKLIRKSHIFLLFFSAPCCRKKGSLEIHPWKSSPSFLISTWQDIPFKNCQ